MKRAMMMILTLWAAVSLPAAADEHAHHGPQTVTNPAWNTLKALVGDWEGTLHEEGKDLPAKTNFRLVSGGSALMSVLGEGTPYEMVTMFHMDLNDLMATHYCAAHNQPRFKAVAGRSPNQVVFEFKDGTNIRANDGHMQRVVLTVIDGDHHSEDWTFREKGKDSTSHFEFQRKP
jgi:hypothetical protein